ncbi:hypothetical protein [Saccharothrix obliqua]|uniref:hypothetical protein n=1 Tax=Saccharothrix obliqua TaxID=2861747 RepID=UPI001C5D21C8|nr:hypothetical protein [Saccharothrix obliqua]MBW4721341.1 hypothetical protein [Saccharothrix obliqua]
MSAEDDDAVRELLDEGLTDWVPVDRVIGYARDIAESTPSDYVEVASRLIVRLIRDGLMMPGDIGSGVFEAWGGTGESLIRRVIEDCRAKSWQPQGSGCWFLNTEEGDRLASLGGASGSA